MPRADIAAASRTPSSTPTRAPRQAPHCSAASKTLADADLGREAIEQLERVLLASYRPGRGISPLRRWGARVPGLLTDYVSMIHAILDAHEAADSEPYTMMAEELAHHVLRTMWDERSGACVDRAHEADEVGLLRESPHAVRRQLRGGVRAFARVARISSGRGVRQPGGRDGPRHGPACRRAGTARGALRARDA